jgi:hypothetical protein
MKKRKASKKYSLNLFTKISGFNPEKQQSCKDGSKVSTSRSPMLLVHRNNQGLQGHKEWLHRVVYG